MRRMLDETARCLIPLDPEACRSGLAKLAGVLKIHLAMEDNALYPRMLAHTDAAVRQTASEYQKSMGQLAPAFETFYEKWRRYGEIESAPDEFIAAWRAIADALKKRMDLEDANLYQVADEHITLAS